MIETMVAIILAPFALAAIIFSGCLVIGAFKGIKQSMKKDDNSLT